MIAPQRLALAFAFAFAFGLALACGGVSWAEEPNAEESDAEVPAVSAPPSPSQPREGSEDPHDASEETERAPAELPRFVPRDVGAPSARVGGATRGTRRLALPRLEALTPEPVGYTLETRPKLYWYLSEPTEHRVDFTLVEQDAATPQLELTLPGPFRAGLQVLRLADHGVELKPGVAYLWYVSLIPDAERRSDDRHSGGGIAVLVAPELSAKLAATPAARQAFVLADAGVWYDAIAVLSDRIDAPGDAGSARAQRDALLEQVGLARLVGASTDAAPAR